MLSLGIVVLIFFNMQRLIGYGHYICPTNDETVKMARPSSGYRKRSDKPRRFEIPRYAIWLGIFLVFI